MAETQGVSAYFFNVLALSPSILLLLVSMAYAISGLNLYIFVPLALVPIAKRFSPSLIKVNTYRIVLIILLLLILDSLASLSHLVPPYLSAISLPASFETVFTLEIALGYLIVVEGIFTQKMFYLVGALVASLADLGELYAAVALMNSPYFGVVLSNFTSTLGSYGLGNVPPMQAALIVVALLEYQAILSLSLHGFMTILPLYSLSLPYSTLLLSTFAVSFLGVIGRFYVEGEKDENFRLEGLFTSVVLGVVISLAVIEFATVFQTYDFQFFVISFLAMVFLIAAVSSSRLTPRDLHL